MKGIVIDVYMNKDFGGNAIEEITITKDELIQLACNKAREMHGDKYNRIQAHKIKAITIND